MDEVVVSLPAVLYQMFQAVASSSGFFKEISAVQVSL